MAKDDDTLSDSDFDKLLQDFINSDNEPEDSGLEDENKEQKDSDDLSAAFAQAREDMAKQENQPTLGSDESELAQAFVNFQASLDGLCKNNPTEKFKPSFSIEDLYPNYKPSIGAILLDDLADGWLILCRMFPDDVGKFSVKSTDEQFLNFAEKLTNQDLQLAVISYVEILIDIDACEISYQAKLIKHQEKLVKKRMYTEYMYRKERQRKFTEALAAKNFPIDADRLISNYFRVSQKDADGAFKALTENPAIFAPIDFAKIKPRFFGLIKVSPQDGIKMNIKIGNFLRHLKV